MRRSFLVFTMAFVALMAGALFYAARMPLKALPEPVDTFDPNAVTTISTQDAIYPSFRLSDMNGVEHDFSEWRDQNRIVNFWATWCAPCRREIPLLKAFQEKHAEHGIQVIGIAIDMLDAVIAYNESAQFNYPILVGELDAMAAAESSGVNFIGLPFTMIVAADGELLATHIGEIHQEHLDKIASVLKHLDFGRIDRESARQALRAL